MFKKSLEIILAIVLIVCSIIVIPVSAAEGVTITTTLQDGATLKGSKKTFDVIARDAGGNKISSSATLNGDAIPVNWDDTEKTSFTLTLTKEGANEIVISAGGATKTVNITYEKAQEGDVTGQAVYCIELFTIGYSYLIEPTKVDIIEGENAAQALIRFIEAQGYGVDYTGNAADSFYLSGIESDTTSLDIPMEPNCPDYILEVLETNYMYPDTERWDADWIGEFDYTYGSGWMYAVNDVFPNVGFGNYYLSDGDVVRVQFTLCYGLDIGSSMLGEPPYEIENRDRLTALIAEVNGSIVKDNENVVAALQDAVAAVSVLNCTENDLTTAYNALNKVYTEEKAIAESTEIKVEDKTTGAVLEAADGVFPKNTDNNTKTETDDTTKPDNNTSPKTGDTAVPYVAVAMISALVCVALLAAKVNRNEI